jgi:hypothetical protein
MSPHDCASLSQSICCIASWHTFLYAIQELNDQWRTSQGRRRTDSSQFLDTMPLFGITAGAIRENGLAEPGSLYTRTVLKEPQPYRRCGNIGLKRSGL